MEVRVDMLIYLSELGYKYAYRMLMATRVI